MTSPPFGIKIFDMYRLEDYDYYLPKHLIAQYPSPKREDCRLMIVNRCSREIIHTNFSNITDYLNENNILVINDTKVIPARLFGKKETGGKVEVLLLEFDPEKARSSIFEARCLIKASRRPKEGSYIFFQKGIKAKVNGYRDGKAQIVFESEMPFIEALKEIGRMPLPPYIKRDITPEDSFNYQTIYAKRPGAIAAPTAGLHFSARVLDALKKKGIGIVHITLHVGYGTFIPVKVSDIRKHKLEGEPFEVSEEAERAINNGIKEGKEIIAVGTTTTRVLEYLATKYGSVIAKKGICDLFIYPGYKFKVIRGLITNFHLPKSTLIMLVCAFADRDLILKAYKEAIDKKYRFYSYGDAMLII